MSFYDNFVFQCTKINKKPSVVAQELGLAKSAVSHWKARGAAPRDVMKHKIADYFGCTIEDLTKENKPGVESDNELDETTKELIDLAYSLNNDDRALLLEMARSIKRRREN